MTRVRAFEDTSRAAGWTFAAAVAIAAWWISRRTPLLVPAPSCAGVGEWAVGAIARVAPHHTIGGIVRALDVVINAIAIVALTRLAAATSRSLVAGAAIGLAFARLFAFTPTFSFTDAAAIAAAAFTLLAAVGHSARVHLRQRLWPWLGAGVWVAIVGLVPVSSCMALPASPAEAAHRLFDALHATFATTSPLAMGLMLLGLVTVALRPDQRRSTSAAAVSAAASVLLAALTTAPAARTLAPVLAIAVALAGCGIRTFREALLLPVTAARRLADAAVLAALVVVRLPSTVPGPAIAAESPLGVESLTLSAFRTLSSDTPADARLVDDDGLVHVLATVTHTPLIAPVPEALRNAAADQPIFALPPTQAALVHEGFALDPVPVSGFAGLARVTAVGECATTRGVWRDATGLIGAGAIAFVAPTPDTRGPIAAYFAGTSPFSPGPRGWPAPALRGWYATVYDHANADQVRALQADLSSDGLPADDPIGGAPFVTRLEMWRVPDAPRILDVGLGSTVTAALVRANNAADPGHVLLCPSRPVAIAPLRVPR